MSTRSTILERLWRKVSADEPISIGIARERRGSLEVSPQDDVTFVYHTSRFADLSDIGGLLPLADANGVVLELAGKLPKSKPLVAGICGTDPFRLLEKLLEQIKQSGFVGVQNFPSLGMMDGHFRARLEESRIGFAQEVAMIRSAHEAGLLTMPLVFNAEQAVQMNKAGADILVVHPGAKAFRKQIDIADFARQAAKIAAEIRSSRANPLLVRYNGVGELVKV